MYPKPLCRNGSKNLFFFYNDPLTGIRRKKSCNTSKKGEAHQFIKEFIDNLTPHSTRTLKNYSQQFFDPETNPRRIRCLAEGKSYGKRNCSDLKQLMEKYVEPEPIYKMELGDITRGDILDLRANIQKKYPAYKRTTNKVIKAIASIFSEAVFRGDLKYNPAAKIGEIKYKGKPKGTFSAEEVTGMFSDPGKWPSILAYKVFKFAAFTGRRASEIYAAQWEQLEDIYFTVDRAWKRDEGIIGGPKWDVVVKIPLAKAILQDLPEKGESCFIFNNNGKRLNEHWWRDNFIEAMEALNIDHIGRNLTPHSFRHSLNTNLLLYGASELYVKKYLGWTDKNKDTQAIYTHIQPEHLNIVADKIDYIYTGKEKIIEFSKEA